MQSCDSGWNTWKAKNRRTAGIICLDTSPTVLQRGAEVITAEACLSFSNLPSHDSLTLHQNHLFLPSVQCPVQVKEKTWQMTFNILAIISWLSWILFRLILTKETTKQGGLKDDDKLSEDTDMKHGGLIMLNADIWTVGWWWWLGKKPFREGKAVMEEVKKKTE